MTQVFLASRNRKKIEELERILREHLPEIEVLGIDDVEGYDEPVEDQSTFEGNALLKARAGYAATGLPSLADDSGLCVDALNGMPGVLSARWSGPPTLRDASSLGSSGTERSLRDDKDDRNNALLLAQLEDVPDERRTAHFMCAVAFVHAEGHDGEECASGVMPGRVVRERRGTGGFGYDSLFEADDRPGFTTAELSREDKDAISHRGWALRRMAPIVARILR